MDLSDKTIRTIMIGWSKRQAYLLHRPTGVVGRAGKYYEPSEYLSPNNDQPVAAPVLLVGGHALVATTAAVFSELSVLEGSYFEAFTKIINSALQKAVEVGGKHQIPLDRTLTFVCAALRSQLGLLEASKAQQPPTA
jgi:hypothetical protein